MGLADWIFGKPQGGIGKQTRQDREQLSQTGPVPVQTPENPTPQPVHYRTRERGIFGWLRDAVFGWPGPKMASGNSLQPLNRVDQELTTEKVRSGPHGIIFPWFAPYLDDRTGETATMRLAYRRMLADPNIKAAILGKILAVCALDLQIIPADKNKVRTGKLARDANARNEEIAEFVDWNLTERVQGCLPELAWAILSGGLVDGYSVNEKIFAYEDRGEHLGRYILTALKPKDVGNTVILQTDEFLNIVGVQALRYSGGQVYSPANFVIYRHLPLYGSPVGMSDLRAVYSRWWFLDTILKLRAMGLEKRALPVMYGEYETTAQKPSLEAALAQVRSQSWLSVPKGVRVEALNIAGSADGMFASAVADLKEDIFLGIQGATLQALTGQEGTQRGSSAVHKTTSQLFTWYLARALEVLLNDRDNGLIRDLVDLNFVTDRYPRAVLGAIDTTEMMAEAQLDKMLLDMGLKLSKAEAYEKYSRTPPTSPDDELGGQQQGQGPGGPGGPGGGMPGMPGAGGPPGAGGGGPGGPVPPTPEKPPEPETPKQPSFPFAEGDWEETKHPRGEGGKFARKGSASVSNKGKPQGKAAPVRESRAAPDSPSGGKGGDSSAPPGGDVADTLERISKDDLGDDWSIITRQDAQQKLRDMVTDPHRLKKEGTRVLASLTEAGKKLLGSGGAVLNAIYDKGGPVVRQIADVGQGLGVGLLALWGYIEHGLESVKHATHALVHQVATERGFPEHQVEKVAGVCATLDALAAWTVNIPLTHEYLHQQHHIGGWAGFALAKIGYFVPVASVAYCAYSTVRNPLAMARAAYKVVAGHGSHGAAKHAEGDPLFGADLVAEVAERMDKAGDGADWWLALFCAAFDQSHDARAAIGTADAAFAEVGTAPDDVDDTDADDITEWVEGYQGPDVATDHVDDSVGIFTNQTRPEKFADEQTQPEQTQPEQKPTQLPPPDIALLAAHYGYQASMDEDGQWVIGDTSIILDDDDGEVDDHADHAEKFDDDHSKPAWSAYQGPRGGKGWKNSVTGQILYQEEQPGGTVGEFHQKKQQAKEKLQQTLKQPVKVSEINNPRDPYQGDTANVLPGMSVEDIGKLTGAQGGSKVTIAAGAMKEGNVIFIDVAHPAIKDCSRKISISPDGQVVCMNSIFVLKKAHRGSGFGLNQFADQVRACAENGVHQIETYAARGGVYNGYYTWARLGYDAPLKDYFKRELPEQFKGAETIQDLMATPEGRAFWKKKGYDEKMTFDLAPGSRSMQVLDAYLAERGKGSLGVDAEKAGAAQSRRRDGVAKMKAEEARQRKEVMQQQFRDAVKGTYDTLTIHAQSYGVDPEAARAEYERYFQAVYEPKDNDPDPLKTELRARESAARMGPYNAALAQHVAAFDASGGDPIHEEMATKAREMGYDPEKVRLSARSNPLVNTPADERIQTAYRLAFHKASMSDYYNAKPPAGQAAHPEAKK